MKNNIIINNLIREARKRRRVTQKELAEALDVSRQTIVLLEKGDYSPSLLLAFKLSYYFHEPIEMLFKIECAE